MWEYGIFLAHLRHEAKKYPEEPAALSRLCREAKERGIVGVTADALELTPENRAVLTETGMKIHTVYFVGDFVHGNGLDDALRAVHRAAEAGAENLMFVGGFPNPEETDASEMKAAARKNAVPLLKRCAEECAKVGMTATVEDYGGYVTAYSHPEDVVWLAEAAGLDIVFDAGNFLYHRRDPLEAWEMMKSRTVQIHAKDLSETPDGFSDPVVTPCGDTLYPVPIGDGCGKAKELYRAMKNDGFSGILTLEHDGYSDLARFEERSLAFLRAAERGE